ncbi:class I SAM-dependent methyltransferase [Laspinema olomoucense]|uniref:class I SAM-dependent methyltransferase n=1 Tax=Laspinema olomoucense TaxID=3231600 RepID=UPI0021BAF5FC|nr:MULTISPECIES: class I SAM-dependent methyltransferase [unclassified Laspinema]MCT7973214.1 class I SAM-dependent methyltransferase [Laspinema sp. D3d]MCT7989439.1 class I SAM-dependent methyltransferase [Laspinema sp. D3a]
MTHPEIIKKQKLFDRWALSYDILFTTIFYQAIHKRLLNYLQLPDSPNVLDLGCGTGRLLDRLAEEFPTLRGTGFDLSPEMIRQARQKKRDRHRPRLIFIQGNAEQLPFADQQFDTVFNTISFLHYPNPSRVLSEVYRVLSPGGNYYLVDFMMPNKTASGVLGGSPANLRLYPLQKREQLGIEAGFCCIGHHPLLGPVWLTIFTKI